MAISDNLTKNWRIVAKTPLVNIEFVEYRRLLLFCLYIYSDQINKYFNFSSWNFQNNDKIIQINHRNKCIKNIFKFKRKGYFLKRLEVYRIVELQKSKFET
jgi:hypothetical protein